MTWKAISIRQPWAWAILHAGKDVENRNWDTKQRGRVLIHAGLKFDRATAKKWAWPVPGLQWGFSENAVVPHGFCDLHKDLVWVPMPGDPLMTRGAIMGSAVILDTNRQDAHPPTNSRWCNGDKIMWHLADPIPFKHPIPYRGQLGFFDVPDEAVPEMQGVNPCG